MENKTLYQDGNVVTWMYEGMQAIGIVDGNEYISVALNYKRDSRIKDGDLWYYDEIETDEDSEVRLATIHERYALMMALHKNGEYFACYGDKMGLIPKIEEKQ